MVDEDFQEANLEDGAVVDEDFQEVVEADAEGVLGRLLEVAILDLVDDLNCIVRRPGGHYSSSALVHRRLAACQPLCLSA